MILLKCLFLLFLTAFCGSEKFEDQCGREATRTTPLVRGGQAVGANEFPWQVIIFQKKGEEFDQICGGSLVRSELVITAAHCFSDQAFDNQVNVSDYYVVAGSLLSSWTALSPGKQTKTVRAVRLGERYGGQYRNFQDDIALVQLTTGFTFSRVVRAVCLDLMDEELHNTQTSPGSVGKVAGWGLTDSGKASDRLNFLSIPVVGDMECINSTNSYTSYVTSDKICAGFTNRSAMCPGDSGAGLVFPQKNTDTSPPRWHLRAVLSNAPTSRSLTNTCRVNVVAFYTSVFKHRIWLSRNMEELQPRVDCRLRGSTGVCREYSECPPAKREAFLGNLPQFCSASGSKICCVQTTCPPLPPSIVSLRKTGSKANDNCVDLAEMIYPCERKGSSWSRGDLCGPEPEEHRSQYWMVPLIKASPSEIQSYGFAPVLTGIPVIMISERWLLTWASGWDYLLWYPAKNITPPPEVVVSISRTVPQPQYFLGTTDIVLVEVDSPIPFSRSHRPICLHTVQDSVGLGGLSLTKWNLWGGKYPATLLSQEECRREFPPSRAAPGGVMDSHLCVTTSTSSEECGSSWNYLTASNGHKVACTRLLVGLNLHFKHEGSTCTGLYLRVSYYIPWLESVVWT